MLIKAGGRQFCVKFLLLILTEMPASQVFLNSFQLLPNYLLFHSLALFFILLAIAFPRPFFLLLPLFNSVEMDIYEEKKKEFLLKKAKSNLHVVKSILHYFCIIAFIFCSGAAEKKNCSNCVIFCNYSGTKILVIGFF